MAPVHGGRQLGGPDGPVSADAGALARLLLQREIEDFLYGEAELLDTRRFDEWLDLFTEDARYWMPMRRNVPHDDRERELTREGLDVNWFDEGKDTLGRRVAQIQTGIHWAEEPPSRTCHMVSNVQIARAAPAGPAPTEVLTRCRFLVYRNRVETETDVLVGKREDVLRRGRPGYAGASPSAGGLGGPSRPPMSLERRRRALLQRRVEREEDAGDHPVLAGQDHQLHEPRHAELAPDLVL
ncbi:MAG: hypothetical protein DME03_03790 [Candidatus Rokuibacteriota bacterium]|nr:MAG: hypothetical protein DME03_03790 [Candidatus Rokubacteria bacterium]